MGHWGFGLGDKELSQAAVKLADDSLSVAIFLEKPSNNASNLVVMDLNGV